jgi:hypothetical protein
MNFINRFGTFLITLGGLGILLFLFSDIAAARNFNYLFAGAALIVVGALLKSTHPKTNTESSTRFSMIKRIRKQQMEKSKTRMQKDKKP